MWSSCSPEPPACVSCFSGVASDGILHSITFLGVRTGASSSRFVPADRMRVASHQREKGWKFLFQINRSATSSRALNIETCDLGKDPSEHSTWMLYNELHRSLLWVTVSSSLSCGQLQLQPPHLCFCLNRTGEEKHQTGSFPIPSPSSTILESNWTLQGAG